MIITLKHTASLMGSSDYGDRMFAEYLQLKIRRHKLENFIASVKAAKVTGRLTPQCEEPIWLLEDQLAAMDNYMRVLKLRGYVQKLDFDQMERKLEAQITEQIAIIATPHVATPEEYMPFDLCADKEDEPCQKGK